MVMPVPIILKMLQGTGTAGRSFKRRPWLRMGCCADDDDDDDDDNIKM
jgi:hypothetical protein